MTVVYPCSDQSSTGSLDDLNGLLRVQRGLKSKSSRHEAKILAVAVEPELLSLSVVVILVFLYLPLPWQCIVKVKWRVINKMYVINRLVD